jgi:hypothetical protein
MWSRRVISTCPSSGLALWSGGLGVKGLLRLGRALHELPFRGITA